MAYQTVTMAPMDSLRFDRRAWPSGSETDLWHAPDGWAHRRFRMGNGARGAMLVLGGRGDMVEKFLEPMTHFAAQGWAVTSLDWRGQGGSGRFLPDPLIGHVEDFAQWVADVEAYAAEWRARDRGPHVILGHSMGGHLVLRAMAEGAVVPDAAVLVAPMLGLNGGLIPAWLGRRIARLMCALGKGEHAAWTQKEDSERQRRLRQARLTHSPDRYADELWWRAQSPSIALGPPSWRWVAQAYDSTEMLERSPALGTLATPTLILAAAADKLVSTAATRRIAARLPNARLHVYGEEAAHEILREVDEVRHDALTRIDAFLSEVAP